MSPNDVAVNLSGEWRIHSPNFFKELLVNQGAGILSRPAQIFANKLAAIAERAVELGDVKLLKLCCDLTLFDEADPLSPDYNPAMVESLRKQLAQEKHHETN